MKKIVSNMPKGVSSLYFIQIFSTFSYAILYSSLSLYLTKQLNMPQTASNRIVGLFLAFNYLLQLVGGYTGGRFLSNRTLFILSMAIESIGLLYLTHTHSSMLYVGLSLFLVGCGLNTSSYNNIMTQRFEQEDNRREIAFILSYAAMSIGFFTGYIVSGFFDFSNQYQNLFYTGIGMNLCTLFLIFMSWSKIADKNTPLKQMKHFKQIFNKVIGTIGALFCIPILYVFFNSADLSNILVLIVGLTLFFIIFLIGLKQKIKTDKERIMAYLILALSSMLFWMIYYTSPIGVILFIKNNADRHLFGYEIATQWLLNINTLTVIISAPVMSLLMTKLKSRFDFSIPMQFAAGFIMLALAFFSLVCGINHSDSYGYIAIYWVMFYFIFQGIAELLITPVGYAMIGRIAPPQLQGTLMGFWMMVSGVAASLSHYFSDAMIKTESIDPLVTNQDYIQIFEQLGVWAIVGAFFLFLISKKIRAFINTESTILTGV